MEINIVLYFHSMFYGFLKIWVRLGLFLFAKSIRISGKQQLQQTGPLVLAINHPNSFLDAILLGVFMKQPVHFLTRGDAFKNKYVRSVLRHINMLPIYRIRDGKDKLSLNQQTFELSEQVLMSGGILLVFVEGFCEHQTTLQLPLKKGAPRVIESCWRKAVPVEILPVWLHYSSFTSFGKCIDISLGNVLTPFEHLSGKDPAIVWQLINQKTANGLKDLEHHVTHKQPTISVLFKTILSMPALLGAVLHAPLYLPLQSIVYRHTRHEVHYDSVLLVVLLLVYPVFLIGLGIALAVQTSWPWFFLPIIGMPLLARAFVLWK